VLGPGSWFTSVLTHLLVPGLAAAITETSARRLVTLNLAPQPGETAGFAPENLLEVLASHAHELRIDVVLADRRAVTDETVLTQVARSMGAELVVADIGVDDGRPVHDPVKLAAAYEDVFTRGRIDTWR